MKALLIAEKPSLRRTIETVYNKHKSEIPYDITFMEQRGHLLTLMLPDELDETQKDWTWENLPFHPEDHGGWQYKVISEKKTGPYLTSSERLSKIRMALETGEYDFVIHAGDPDQEGELLIRETLQYLHNTLPVKRFWSNDITEQKVLEALKNLRDDDHDSMLVNLGRAAYGRQHSDYRFGMNISRAATLKMGSAVACGRVKTPIQAIVCRREKEIENFKPSTSYGVIAKYGEGFTGQYYNPSAASSEEDGDEKEQAGNVYFDTKQEAEDFISSLPSSAVVKTCEKKRVETYAPKLFKLATAQIAAGKFGLNSAQTLETIQSLYEAGYLSYPRTDCEYLSSHENFSAMLKSASSVPMLKPFIDSIDPSVIGKVKGTKKWVNDKKLEDSGHSALAPTTKAPDFNSLTGPQKIIYTIICRQFAAIFLPPLVQDKVSLIADAGGNLFRSSGKTLIDPGYTKIFQTKFTDTVIPPHRSGDSLSVSQYDVAEKTTTCPKRFTDADLIALCEAPHKYLDDQRLKSLGKRLVIGTPATRSSIIAELIDKNHYLQRVKEGKATHIVPTSTGMQIWENLKDLDICKVDMTGEWEEMLEQVRGGSLPLNDMESTMRTSVEQLIGNIKSNTDMTRITAAQKKMLCKCPKCGGDIISGPKSFYCTGHKASGCEVGAFKKICDSTVSDKDFASMLSGKTVTMTIHKADKKWQQMLKYDFDQHKIVFVREEAHESSYTCPKCGAPLSEDGWKFTCTTAGCGFKFWKTACGKALTKAQIDSFFKTKDTGLVKGMKSKAGKLFNAHLVLNEDQTGTSFRFENKPANKK